MQKQLPYRLKPKQNLVSNDKKSKKEGDTLVSKHTVVMLEPHESKVNRLMKVLDVVNKDRIKTNRKVAHERHKKHKLEVRNAEMMREIGIKKSKKANCRLMSKREQSKVRKAIDSTSK
ncbi:unnamed protein product [Anisakis simplex]|uniref:Uncharacterized protein n=1 Tax=Anisakis simplex TaxID=6269 RepID=A0A3P6NH80_ANISI|nr:unnamed protein product [Anisakis simplex]